MNREIFKVVDSNPKSDIYMFEIGNPKNRKTVAVNLDSVEVNRYLSENKAPKGFALTATA